MGDGDFRSLFDIPEYLAIGANERAVAAVGFVNFCS